MQLLSASDESVLLCTVLPGPLEVNLQSRQGITLAVCHFFDARARVVQQPQDSVEVGGENALTVGVPRHPLDDSAEHFN